MQIAAAYAEIEELERQIREKKAQIHGWQQEIEADEERVASSAAGATLCMYIDPNPSTLPQATGGLPGGAARAAARGPTGTTNKDSKKKGSNSGFLANLCGSKPTSISGFSVGNRSADQGRALAPQADRHLSHDRKRVIDHSLGSTSIAFTPQKVQPQPEPEPEPEPEPKHW